jgi:hypothetical protein
MAQKPTPQPHRRRRAIIALALAGLVGLCEALLLTRLLARLLAARPDNPAIQALYHWSDPLVRPFKWIGIDSQQPMFGAVLELSTLMLAILVLVCGYFFWFLLVRTTR